MSRSPAPTKGIHLPTRIGLRSPRRRRAAFVAVILTIILAGAIGGAAWVRFRDVADQATASAWQRVLDRIAPDGKVSFETALDAFSLAVGPLPGVAMPAGRRERIPSATGAIRWLGGYRDRLTDAQRAAVDRYLAPDPGATRVEPSSASVWTSPTVALAAYREPRSAAVEPHARTLVEEQFLRYLDDARGKIARRLGRGLNLPYTLAINEEQETDDHAYTLPHFGLLDRGAPAECEFRVNPSMFEPGFGEAEFRASMAHEMFHCFQVARMSGAAQWTSTLESRPWLIEGSAAWVGEDLGGPSKIGLIWWDLYLQRPEVSLFKREYLAIGFYLHMVERNVDPWVHLDKMMYAGNEVAYHEAADPGGDPFLDTWASGQVRERALGEAWLAQGPWSTAAHAPVTSLIVPVDAVRPIDAAPYTAEDYRVTTPAEILHVQPEGHVRMADGAGFDAVVTVPLLLCVAGAACACPAGMTDTGPTFITVSQPIAVALTGAVGGASLIMRGESFKDRCEPAASGPRASSQPPGGGRGAPGCGNRCPTSNGDPHLRTVDGVGYDFQAAGEFVLLRTPDGSVEVQVRQEPSPGVELGWVSNNTALAVRIGSHRVAVYASPTGTELRVDGVVQIGNDLVDVGGGHIERHADGIQMELPDGTVVWALSIAPYGINVLVDPSPAVVADGIGLLGRSAPGLRIPRLPDGTALPAPIDRNDAYASLYQRFADAWRLTDASTLFDYASGKSPASYTIADYPAAPKVAGFHELDPAKSAAALQTCAPIADVELRDQCAFDVVVTNDPGYVRPYVAVERVVLGGTAGLDPPAVPGANAPVEVLPAFHALAGSALAPDGTLYLSVVMADRSSRVLAIDPLTGVVLRQAATTGAGEVAVAARAVWVGEFTAPATGPFQPCSVSRLDPATLAIQATISTACDRTRGVTDLAALGDDVWFEDSTSVDAAGKGAVLRRIDGATNVISSSAIAVPFADGDLRASATALFYGDPDKGQYRLRPADGALSRIGKPDVAAFPPGVPAGDGLWAVVDGQLALYTTANGPDGTVDLNDADGGIFVAADSQSVYLERMSATGRSRELSRRYLDGRLPVRLAVAGQADTGFGREDLLYFDLPTLLVGETSVVKLWSHISRTDPNESLLLVQGARLPTN